MKAVRLILPYSVVLLCVLTVTTMSITWQRNAAFLGLSKLFLAGHEPLSATLREQAREFFANSGNCGVAPCVSRQFALERRAALVKSTPYLTARLGRVALNAGREAQKRGDSNAARQYYEDAAGTSVRQVQLEAVARQATLVLSSQSNVALTSALADAATLMPIISTVSCRPLEPVGILVDEWDVAMDAPVHWTVLWKPVDGQVHPGEEIQTNAPTPAKATEMTPAGSYLLQTGVSKNIIPDGGFEELLAPRSGLPQALPYALYSAQVPKDTAVEFVTSEQGGSMALVLKGNDRGLVGLGSAVIDVTHTQSSAYLVVGRYRSDLDARPQIGLRWLTSTNVASEIDRIAYVVTTPSVNWQYFAGILSPPPGITAVQLWAISANEGTNIWVDDLAVIEIQLPCTSVTPS
jgi:hypothetical protein